MRHMWGTCTNCNITVSWEVSTDATRDADLPLEDELALLACPSCDAALAEGADPTARWEQEDSKLIPALRRAEEAEKERDAAVVALKALGKLIGFIGQALPSVAEGAVAAVSEPELWPSWTEEIFSLSEQDRGEDDEGDEEVETR